MIYSDGSAGERNPRQSLGLQNTAELVNKSGKLSQEMNIGHGNMRVGTRSVSVLCPIVARNEFQVILIWLNNLDTQ